MARPGRRGRALMVAVALSFSVAACTPVIDHRGYLPRAGDLQQVRIGMSKAEVEGLLGSPSTTASIQYNGDSYYYISSIVEERGAFGTTETSRSVFAIRFDQADQVESFGHYGLEDGRVIDINTRKTPTKGRELTILEQVLGNIGANPFGVGQ